MNNKLLTQDGFSIINFDESFFQAYDYKEAKKLITKAFKLLDDVKSQIR